MWSKSYLSTPPYDTIKNTPKWKSNISATCSDSDQIKDLRACCRNVRVLRVVDIIEISPDSHTITQLFRSERWKSHEMSVMPFNDRYAPRSRAVKTRLLFTNEYHRVDSRLLVAWAAGTWLSNGISAASQVLVFPSLRASVMTGFEPQCYRVVTKTHPSFSLRSNPICVISSATGRIHGACPDHSL